MKTARRRSSAYGASAKIQRSSFTPCVFSISKVRGCFVDVEVHPTKSMTYRMGPTALNRQERFSNPRHSNPGDSRTKIRQHPYKCSASWKRWDQKPTVCFLTRGSPGVRVSDASEGRVEDLDDKDDFPFDMRCNEITIRIHFFGYDSSTDVEEKKRGKSEGCGIPSTRPMRLSTKIRNIPMTKGKLAEEVSKRIQSYVSCLNNHEWCRKQGETTLENMVITGLVNVSSSYWSPIIYIEQHS